MCKKWIEKHKISEARSSLFYVLLMNVHGIGSANHKSALKEKGDNVSNNAGKKQKNGKVSKKLVQKYLLCVPHYPRVGKASWSRLNSPVVEHWFTTKKQQNADIILFCLNMLKDCRLQV